MSIRNQTSTLLQIFCELKLFFFFFQKYESSIRYFREEWVKKSLVLYLSGGASEPQPTFPSFFSQVNMRTPTEREGKRAGIDREINSPNPTRAPHRSRDGLVLRRRQMTNTMVRINGRQCSGSNGIDTLPPPARTTPDCPNSRSPHYS